MDAATTAPNTQPKPAAETGIPGDTVFVIALYRRSQQ